MLVNYFFLWGVGFIITLKIKFFLFLLNISTILLFIPVVAAAVLEVAV